LKKNKLIYHLRTICTKSGESKGSPEGGKGKSGGDGPDFICFSIPTPTPPTFWQVIVADVMMMIIIIAIAVLRALPHATELQISTRDLGSHACIDIDSIGASQTGGPDLRKRKNKAGFHDKVSPYAGSRSAGAAQVQGAACRCSRVHWCGVRRAFVGRIERQSADCSLQCIPPLGSRDSSIILESGRAWGACSTSQSHSSAYTMTMMRRPSILMTISAGVM